MLSTESPLKRLLAELDVDSEHAPSNGEDQQKLGIPYCSSGKDFQFRSDPFRSGKPAMGKRIARGVALSLFAVLVGVGGTLASQSYRDEIVRLFPPFGWFTPDATITAPVPATISDLQEQLKPLAVDLGLVRRSIEQLTFNLDQLARKQDQLAQDMATLEAAEQESSQKISAPPPAPAPKPVHVPLPPLKSLQPPAQ
jgi:hypothetical protein